MATCPICNSSLSIEEKDYGTLFTCPNCSGVSFCDWNGQLEAGDYSQSNEAAGIQTEANPLYESSLQQNPVDFSPSLDFPESNLSSLPTTDQVDRDIVIHQEATVEQDSSYQSNPSEEMSIDSNFSQSNLLSDWESGSDESVPDFLNSENSNSSMKTPIASGLSSQVRFDDVAAFGNSTETHELVPFYRVEIEGLDTAELRNLFFEAINDSRFGWQPNEVLSGLQSGKVQINALSITKTSVLIQRIKHLPIIVRWYTE